MAAAQLFKERGYERTTLLDVAQAIGVTRTAVYHYFSSKEQMFYHLVERAIQNMSDVFEEVATSDSPPEEKLRRMLRMYLLGVMENGPRMWLLLTEAERILPPRQYRRLHRVVRQNDATLTRIFREGVRSGRFVGLHPKIAVFIMAGACNWLSRWYDPAGEVDADTIADTFLQIVEHGYLAEK